MSTNTVSKLAYTPQLESNSYTWRQNDYDYDPETLTLYIGGSRGAQQGVHKFVLGATPTASFMPLDPSYFVTVVNDRPVGVDVPGQYGILWGMTDYDPATKAFYGNCIWNLDYGKPGDMGENTKFGLIKFNFNGAKFVFTKFIEVGFDNFISNLTFDPALGKFFAERSISDTKIELVAVDLSGDIFSLGTAVANVFNGTNDSDFYLALGGNDVVLGLGGNDKLDGGVGNDRVVGGLGADQVVGGVGNDVVVGAASNDGLSGGTGNDLVIGGAGRDLAAGGAGSDTFDFNALSEMGSTAPVRDVIRDFQPGVDHIDVSTVDANGSAAGSTAFKFLAAKGAAFTGVKGQLHWFQQNPAGTANDKTIVEGDINGDKVADFQIELTGLKILTAGDFIL